MNRLDKQNLINILKPFKDKIDNLSSGDNTDLDKIHKEISKCRTLFDENLNYRIDKILNNSNEEDIENKKFIQMCISKIEEKQSRKLNTEEIRLIKTVAPIMRLTATEDEN